MSTSSIENVAPVQEGLGDLKRTEHLDPTAPVVFAPPLVSRPELVVPVVFAVVGDQDERGLKSDDLVRRKDGRVVSKAKSEIGAQNPWAKFVKKVHAETGGSLSDAMVEAKRQLDGLMRERGLANTAENRREVLSGLSR
eukprot:jgi/Mesvir1/7807/Mv11749-RA.1